MASIIPVCRVPINVRVATMADLPFIDGLQKMHSKMVGWMPTKQLEGKIRAGQVVIAEERDEEIERRRDEVGMDDPSLRLSVSSSLRLAPVGYAIFRDQYFKRDDVGIIYQLNIVPGKQRSFVGATLIKSVFERAAYGCRLFCCWCAQDIEANHFWESLGFVPLAFRAGSREKGRVHIFWQRRIRAGDTTTPYWFPSQTTAGSIREDRLVFPIPPRTHWSDAKPIILPGTEIPKLEYRNPRQIQNPKSKIQNAKRAGLAASVAWFVKKNEPAEQTRQKPPRQPRPKAKNDPRLVAAARELRDRWLEHVNAGEEDVRPLGKYDVSRPELFEHAIAPMLSLPAAA